MDGGYQNIANLQIFQLPPSPAIDQTNLNGFIFGLFLVFFFRSFGCHFGNSSEVTLAFEDGQVIQSFSREQTN